MHDRQERKKKNKKKKEDEHNRRPDCFGPGRMFLSIVLLDKHIH